MTPQGTATPGAVGLRGERSPRVRAARWQDARMARRVAIAATGPVSLAAGRSVARAGGNAVDVAVAAAFADDAKVWRGWKRAVEALGDAGGADRVADLALRELALR